MEIMLLLRPQDELILQTQHKVKPWNGTATMLSPTKHMNERVKKIAGFFKLNVFDSYSILGKRMFGDKCVLVVASLNSVFCFSGAI